jgi:hypothetical protein
LPEDPVVYSGCMLKPSVFKLWTLRFFELRRSGLLISRKKDDPSSALSLVLQISYDTVITPTSGFFGFSVKLRAQVCYYFRAQDSCIDGGLGWLQALRKVQVDVFQRRHLLPDTISGLFSIEHRTTSGESGDSSNISRASNDSTSNDDDEAGAGEGDSGTTDENECAEVEGNSEVGLMTRLGELAAVSVTKPRNISPMPGTSMGKTGHYKNEFGKVVGYVVEADTKAWTPVEQRDIKVPKMVMRACVGTVQV